MSDLSLWKIYCVGEVWGKMIRRRDGGHCDHIFALYLLNHWFLLGIRELHEMQADQTCTSVPQQWHKPRGVIIIWLIPRACKMNQIKRKWVSWSNRALWFATRGGRMELTFPLGTSRCVPQERFPRKPYNKSLLAQVSPRVFFCETHEKISHT